MSRTLEDKLEEEEIRLLNDAAEQSDLRLNPLKHYCFSQFLKGTGEPWHKKETESRLYHLRQVRDGL